MLFAVDLFSILIEQQTILDVFRCEMGPIRIHLRFDISTKILLEILILLTLEIEFSTLKCLIKACEQFLEI